MVGRVATLWNVAVMASYGAHDLFAFHYFFRKLYLVPLFIVIYANSSCISTFRALCIARRLLCAAPYIITASPISWFCATGSNVRYRITLLSQSTLTCQLHLTMFLCCKSEESTSTLDLDELCSCHLILTEPRLKCGSYLLVLGSKDCYVQQFV